MEYNIMSDIAPHSSVERGGDHREVETEFDSAPG